jgi:glutamate synthase (NADPH) small chain
MSEPRGFLRVHRVPEPERDPRTRARDHGEIFQLLPEPELRDQAARCMGCGVPFCNNGCPLGNLIPDWNDLVRQGRWQEAVLQLEATNNFPEFTGLICPAPCESACVLDINDDPVMIKQVEYAIAERGFEEGWIKPHPPAERSGKRVAVVGSGPAGMAAAVELNRVGHLVTVFERDEAPGGLIRFGVPDAKLEKWMIDRRVALLEEEGIEFRCETAVGEDVSAEQLQAEYDALLIAIGSRVERDLDVPGRELDGVHFAMDYLYQRNRAVARAQGRPAPEPEQPIVARDKRVIVVGGGDTGMDCISNANREGATSERILDVYPELPESGRYPDAPWPLPFKRTATTYALDEGGERRFATQVTSLEGRDGKLVTVQGRQVTGTSSRDLEPVPGSEFSEPADLCLIAIGFTHPSHDDVVGELSLELDERGNVRTKRHASSEAGVFAAGDARVGQSLIVTAIADGRRAARRIEAELA